MSPSNIRWKNRPKVYLDFINLQGHDREVEILAETNKKGKVKRVKLIKSSGLYALDVQCLLAMKKASFIPYQENGIYYPIRVLQPFSIEVSRKPKFEVFPKIKVKKSDLKGETRYISIYSEADDLGNLTLAKIQSSSGLQELDDFVLQEFRKQAKFYPLIVNGKPYPINDTTNYTFSKYVNILD